MTTTPEFDTALQRLLSAWVTHHDLVTSGGDIAELYESRQALNHARLDARAAGRIIA